MGVSDAEYQKRWRAKHGANTGQPGRPVTAQCGTVSAYKRHQRNGEQPCDACREANAAYHRELYQRRKQR